MAEVTTAPATATPAASFTTTTGWAPGAQTSWSSAFEGGCRLIVIRAGGPATASWPLPSGAGRVRLSPLQVIERTPSAETRRILAVRVVGIRGNLRGEHE